jgi:hypothetical protein
MPRPFDTARIPTRRRTAAAAAPVLLAAITLSAGLAGCGAGSHGVPSATEAMPAASMAAAPAQAGAGTPAAAPAVRAAVVPAGTMRVPTRDEVDRAWQARPDFVRQLPKDGQAAYAFALARPDVLQWLPCYCGCAAMDHRSNLDCFFKRRDMPGSFAYEEHASYCDVCIDTANLAMRMLTQNASMAEIRAAVDASFGGNGAPGTDTALPPA